MEPPHGFKHMIGKLAARPMSSSAPNGISHIGGTDASGILVVSRQQRFFRPLGFAGQSVFYRPAEGVGIRNEKRTLGAVNFNIRKRAASKTSKLVISVPMAPF